MTLSWTTTLIYTDAKDKINPLQICKSILKHPSLKVGFLCNSQNPRGCKRCMHVLNVSSASNACLVSFNSNADIIYLGLKSNLTTALLTSKQMVLQASTGHEFIHQQPLVILRAVPNQFHQILVMKLTKKVHLCLESRIPKKKPS